ncbi:MAG TPA: F0F1 ATP synthase subunit B [Actinophytocola sp.]|uniref:F0F1 ATP synthase subunit B n=1 Tax=Actinophytocola sp. TaxID=1872138 RepID=UPI002DB63E45|nr:F0F1 ATP synthase subunit B [Actinophytocola sp.]HEU5470022.1 F0F1 ATP synthase subunit B [Actinophytocola sp.]
MAAFIAELIAFALILYVLWRYVAPPVRGLMHKQQATIGKQVEFGVQASERLAEAERKFQEAVAEARTEAAKIRDSARADSQRIVEELRQFAQQEVERIRQRGQDDLASMRLQVMRELRARIGELTVARADELIRERLSDDTRRSATVDRFLGELDAMAAPEPAEAPKPRARRTRASATSKGES